MKKQPGIIISTYIGSFKRYVLQAPFGPNNKRKPSFTEEMEKAQKFHEEWEANNFISRLPPNRKYEAEPLQKAEPAGEKI